MENYKSRAKANERKISLCVAKKSFLQLLIYSGFRVPVLLPPNHVGHAQVLNTQPLNHSRSSQPKEELEMENLLSSVGILHTTDKKHTRNFEKKLPEWNNKLEGFFISIPHFSS